MFFEGEKMPFEDLGLLFFTVLILSLLITPVSIRFAQYMGAIDHPVDRSVHSTGMPRLGGLGMALALLLGLPLFVEINQIFMGFLSGLLIIILIGCIDDIWHMQPLIKMIGQIVACLVFLEISGLSFSSLGNLFGLGELSFSAPVNYAITLFCMVGLVNALNLSDGLDGLAAGSVAIACFFLGVLALVAQNWVGMALIAALIGGVLGFLKFNSYPAKLFMGDSGSMMLGFSIACLTIILAGGDSGNIQPVTLSIVLGVPIVDTVWVMTRRVMQGKSPMYADKTHLHHRLLALGLPHALVVSLLYALMVLFGILALTVQAFPAYWQSVSGVSLAVLVYALLMACEHKKVMVQISVSMMRDEREIRYDMTSRLGRSMKVFPFVILSGLSLPLLVAQNIPAEMSWLALGLAVLVAVAFPWKEHRENSSVVSGLFYLCTFAILFTWNHSSYGVFRLDIYEMGFAAILFIWVALKIIFKRNNEIFLTSSLELLLIFISWFVPYIVLPAVGVSEPVLNAAKFTCLEAIPLFVALKLIIKRQPDRNTLMAAALLLMLCFTAIRAI